MSISSNNYSQFRDYLTQVMNVSGKNGIPKITQGTVAQKLDVDSSGVSRFLNGQTQKPSKMMTNFIATYPLEFNRWPNAADRIHRLVTSSDALYFLNPQQSAPPQIAAMPISIPFAPPPQPRQMRAPIVSIPASSVPIYQVAPSTQIPVARGVDSYFRRFRAGDTTVPGAAVQKSIATLLDRTEATVVNDLLNTLRMSDEHRARIGELNAQPTLAGKFNSDKVIFDYETASSFEQMAALSDWLAQKKIRTDHTFFFSVPNDDYIPVYVKKYATEATAMHVRLGATQGTHKAPKYEDWAGTDPWFNDAQKRFIHPLEALEIVRQPNFSAATMLKGNAYERDLVDTNHRYGLEYACVEEKGQSKNSSKKINSAGLNACSFTHIFSDRTDPTADEFDVTLPVNYEDYTEDGYLDDLDIGVTPGKLMKAAEKVLINNYDDGELTRLMENLTIAKLGVQRTPMLSEHIARKLEANNKAD